MGLSRVDVLNMLGLTGFASLCVGIGLYDYRAGMIAFGAIASAIAVYGITHDA